MPPVPLLERFHLTSCSDDLIESTVMSPIGTETAIKKLREFFTQYKKYMSSIAVCLPPNIRTRDTSGRRGPKCRQHMVEKIGMF